MEHRPLYYPAPVPGFPGECRCCGGPEDGHFDGCEVGALETECRIRKEDHLKACRRVDEVMAVAKQLAEALEVTLDLGVFVAPVRYGASTALAAYRALTEGT